MLVLASGSPQRRAILEQLGVEFEVIVSDAEELTAGPPEEVVRENSYRKAAAVAAGLGHGDAEPPRPVLGVDTEVALGQRVYGKPQDEVEARAMLQELSGREHRVLSGITVIRGEQIDTSVAVTTVTFRPLDAGWLDWYVGTGEWRGRAGGYAIQARGAALVTQITGDYLSVVGLPVATLLELVPDLLRGSKS